MLTRRAPRLAHCFGSLIACTALLFTGAADEFAPEAPSLPAGTSAAWWESARHQLAEREYRASENDAGLQAPNRRHNLRAYFEKTGLRLVDRSAAGSPELLHLSLVAVGRGEALAPAAPGEELTAHENRVEIQRPGILEWYVNSAQGLEQGFTLTERPGGEGPLVLELSVAGARPRLRGDSVVFETPAQRKLRYGDLQASDAAGTLLVASLELPSAARLRLVVEDGGAAYPISIDPLLTATADTQIDSDQANALLGASVAGAGDVNGDGYDDVIVGAEAYDAGQNSGAAFVFVGSAAGIVGSNPGTAAAVLESSDAGALMGASVAGAGDVNNDGYDDVIVGAEEFTNGQNKEGAAFVFLGNASGIATTAGAQLESNDAFALMGGSVAGAGDVNGDGYDDVIVGAEAYASGDGAAFVFLGSSSGIVGSNPSTAAAGIESDQANALLGASVAAAGDVNDDGYDDVIVGAEAYPVTGGDGAAFVFLGSASGIAGGTPAAADTRIESDQSGGLLGGSVAAAGDVNGDGYDDVVIGADAYDAGQTDEGAAFVFLGSATGIADGTPGSGGVTQLESNQTGAAMGRAAGVGDVNGDGYDDVLVGAEAYDAGHTDEGAAFLFLGSASGITTTAAAQLEANDAGALFGASLAGAGDVNGDGGADVIVGAEAYASGDGAAFVYHGVPACGDGFDNDGDGLVDFPADTGCTSASDTDGSERALGSSTLVCDNGVNDDTDVFIDYPADPGCRYPSSLKENPQCQDGANNDGQVGTDYDGGVSVNGPPGDPNGADPQCNQPWKDQEAVPPPAPASCGIGIELIWLMPLLMLARRRR